MTDLSKTANTSSGVSPDSVHSRPSPLSRRINQWAFSPASSKNRAIDFLRICLRIVLIMYQEFFRTHLAIRASALTYSIVLSLVPILALSTSILKGLGNDEQLKLAATRFIEQLEPPVSPSETGRNILDAALPEPPLLTPALPPTEQQRVSITTHLHHAVDIILQYVNRTNFAALGILGVIGLIGVVILVLSSIENAMNAIWHTHKGRSFFRKIMDYLALLILLPISLNIALAAEAILASEKIMSQVSMIVPTAWVAAFVIKLVPFMFIVLTLMIMYLFFPHVKVKTGAALAGAVFASIFWFIFQKIYIVLQVGVASYNAIYGSFATIPLFLIWLQIGWTFILLGASLAHALQIHHHYNIPANTLSPQRRLQTAFDILETVYDNFEKRLTTPLAQLKEKFPKTSCAEIDAVATLLINGRLLSSNESNNEEILTPVTSMDKLRASEVVELVLGNELLPSRGGKLASQAIDAASNALQSDLFLRSQAEQS
jgi:membrane protein